MNELIIEKFHACTGVQKHIIYGWQHEEKQAQVVDSVDMQKYMELIENYDMKEFSKLLLCYMNFQRGQNRPNKASSDLFAERQMENAKSNKIKSELLNFFEKIFSKGKLTTVTFSMSKDSAQITNSELINLLVESLKKEFYKRKYDITPLTTAEVEKIYNDKTDEKWFEGWKQVLEYFDEKGNPVNIDDLKEGEKYYDATYGHYHDIKFIMNDMFYAYAYEHPKKRIIDLQLINYLKAEQDEEKGKENGRKEKNKIITQTAFVLADLKRIDEFIKNAKLTEIDQITVKDEVGKFIYDCLLCFKMIEDKSKKFNKDYQSHDYAKTFLRNKKKSKKFDLHMFLRKERLSSFKSKYSNI